MAQSTFTTEVSRGAATWHGLPEEIQLPPLNLSGRASYDEADILALAHEIASRGQDTPVLIRKGKDGKPVLVYGRRRYHAVQKANELGLGKKGPIELVATYETDMTEEQALIAAIAENFQRKEVNDADHAHNIGELLKFAKQTPEKVAGIYFPGAVTPEQKADALRWVKVRAGIEAELVQEGKQAMRTGLIETTTATEMAKLTPEKQQEIIADPKNRKIVKGKERITVQAVKAHKPAPQPRKGAKAEPGKPTAAAGAVYLLAEDMALAIERWDTDDDETEEAEQALLDAVEAYRAVVPNRAAAKKAASHTAAA